MFAENPSDRLETSADATETPQKRGKTGTSEKVSKKANTKLLAMQKKKRLMENAQTLQKQVHASCFVANAPLIPYCSLQMKRKREQYAQPFVRCLFLALSTLILSGTGISEAGAIKQVVNDHNLAPTSMDAGSHLKGCWEGSLNAGTFPAPEETMFSPPPEAPPLKRKQKKRRRGQSRVEDDDDGDRDRDGPAQEGEEEEEDDGNGNEDGNGNADGNEDGACEGNWRTVRFIFCSVKINLNLNSKSKSKCTPTSAHRPAF